MGTQDEVLRLVAEVLDQPLNQLTTTDHFITDLGASSLDVVTLVMRVEQHFSLGETPDEQLEQIGTIGDLIELVRSLRGHEEPSEVLDTTDLLIASDHAGVTLKAELITWLRQHGWTVQDLGPADTTSVDYPEFAGRLAHRIARGDARLGVLICGSGIGMSIAANKVPGVRAALVHSALEAELARRHNHANVLCLGARIIGSLAATSALEAFLTTDAEDGDDGRHRRRVEQLESL